MVLCSGVAQNECKVIPTQEKLFDNYYDCIVYCNTTRVAQAYIGLTATAAV